MPAFSTTAIGNATLSAAISRSGARQSALSASKGAPAPAEPSGTTAKGNAVLRAAGQQSAKRGGALSAGKVAAPKENGPITSGHSLTGAASPKAPSARPVPPRSMPASRPAAPAANAGKPLSTPAPNSPGMLALSSVGANLTAKQLGQAAGAEVALALNPAVNTLQGELGQLNKQTGQAAQNTAGYFNQLGQYINGSVNQSGKIANSLNQTLAGIGQNEQNTLARIGQQEGAIPGLAGDPSVAKDSGAVASLAKAMAQQQGFAAQSQGGFEKLGAILGSNNQQYANQLQGVAGLRGQETIGRIETAGQQKAQPIVSKLGQLQAERPVLYDTDLTKLRQQELTNQVTRAGLGIRQEQVDVTAKNDRTRNLIAKQNADTAATNAQTKATQVKDQAQLGWARLTEQQKRDAATNAYHQASLRIKAKNGQTNPLSTKDNNTMTGLFGYATTLLSEVPARERGALLGNLALGIGEQKDTSGKKVTTGLHSPIPAPLLQAALQSVNHGTISHQVAAQLNAMGIRGLTYNGQPLKVQG